VPGRRLPIMGAPKDKRTLRVHDIGFLFSWLSRRVGGITSGITDGVRPVNTATSGSIEAAPKSVGSAGRILIDCLESAAWGPERGARAAGNMFSAKR